MLTRPTTPKWRALNGKSQQQQLNKDKEKNDSRKNVDHTTQKRIKKISWNEEYILIVKTVNMCGISYIVYALSSFERKDIHVIQVQL